MDKNKVLQVCELWDCDCEPVMNVKFGDKTHNFCCLKEMGKSIKDFTGYLSKLPKLSLN